MHTNRKSKGSSVQRCAEKNRDGRLVMNIRTAPVRGKSYANSISAGLASRECVRRRARQALLRAKAGLA